MTSQALSKAKLVIILGQVRLPYNLWRLHTPCIHQYDQGKTILGNIVKALCTNISFASQYREGTMHKNLVFAAEYAHRGSIICLSVETRTEVLCNREYVKTLID